MERRATGGDDSFSAAGGGRWRSSSLGREKSNKGREGIGREESDGFRELAPTGEDGRDQAGGRRRRETFLRGE